MGDGNKEVDNTEGICSTRSVIILGLILIETSIANSFVGFRFRQIFSKWSGNRKLGITTAYLVLVFFIEACSKWRVRSAFSGPCSGFD